MTPFKTPTKKALWLLSDRCFLRIPQRERITLIGRYQAHRVLNGNIERIVLTWYDNSDNQYRLQLSRLRVRQWIEQTDATISPEVWLARNKSRPARATMDFSDSDVVTIPDICRAFNITASTVRSYLHIYKPAGWYKSNGRWHTTYKNACELFAGYIKRNNGKSAT